MQFFLFFAHINNVNTLLIITSLRSLELVGLKEYLLLHSCTSQSPTLISVIQNVAQLTTTNFL